MREMKKTGIPWLPEVAEDFSIGFVKQFFYISKDPSNEGEPDSVLKLARAGVIEKDVTTNEGQMAASYVGYNKVQVGDLLINPMDLYSGANCNVSNLEGVISPAYTNLRAIQSDSVVPKFYDYYFKCQYWLMAMFAHGKGVSFDNRWTLNNDTLRMYEIPVIRVTNQQKIVDFLQIEEKKVDALIVNQEAQIEKLKAYKQSLITEAVTKGLNPNVPMKDSGVEWIGKIPESWKVIKTGRLFKEKVRNPDGTEISLSLSQVDGLIATDDMKENSLKTSTYENWKRVEVGDLVLNRFKAHLGVIFSANLSGIVSFHYGVYAAQVPLLPKYYEYLFHSDQYRAILGNASNGMVVGLQNLSNLNFYSTWSLYPPHEVQKKIVEYLENKCSQIDRLVSIKRFKIEKLNQFKKSLIYEYVTGKKEVM